MRGVALAALMVTGCSTAWIGAARDSVDALNAATTIAWREYAGQAKDECTPLARTCAGASATLEACPEYEACIRQVKTVAQAVIGFHELVEQARRVLDVLEDDPDNASNAARARQLWRLVLKHAGAIADLLARGGVPLEVPQ